MAIIEQLGAAKETPVRAPVFTQVMHIGIVVRDLEATVTHSGEEYGIGLWQQHALTPPPDRDLRVIREVFDVPNAAPEADAP